MTASSTVVRRLVGVYDADGDAWGELRYWVGARLGRAHCALCDITHGLVRERGSWQSCRAELPVAFDTYHRDDQPAGVRAASEDRVPVVLAETDGGFTLLLGPEAIERCDGSGPALVAAVRTAATAVGLVLDETPS